MKGIYGKKAKEDAKESADATTAAAQPSDKTKPSDEKAKAGAGTAKEKIKQKYDENLSEEQKEKIRARNEDYRRRAREYFNKKMPKERKDQTIWRLKVRLNTPSEWVNPGYQRKKQLLTYCAPENDP